MGTSHDDYDLATHGLNEFGDLLCGLIKELLAQEGVQIHSIAYRVKNFESSLRKLDLKGDRYDDISDLTDLLGVRVITYFPKDVDRVAEVIRREFKIDEINSVDKRKTLDPNQFGYLSLHIEGELHEKRSKLTEYKRHSNKKFELQTRSILQHAWAEIEHDLGYKVKSGLPDPLRRRFSMLAGSLELIDEEFERLRVEINEYENQVDARIKDSPQSLPINQSTLVASLESDFPLNELDKVVIKARHSGLRKDIDPSYIVKEGENLKSLGIENIEQLHEVAEKYINYVGRFAEIWLAPSLDDPLNSAPAYRGIGMFYLNYVLAAQRSEDDLVDWGLNISTRNKDLIPRIKETWKQVVKELGKPQA